MDKRHPGIAKIHKWVMEQYAQGRTTNISGTEMEEKVKKHLSEFMVSDLDVMKQKAKDIAVHLVEGVAEQDVFKKMDKKGIEKALQKLVDDNPFIQFAYVVNTDGKKVTKNITQIIDKATYEHYGLDEDFSDRNWFISPIEGRQEPRHQLLHLKGDRRARHNRLHPDTRVRRGHNRRAGH